MANENFGQLYSVSLREGDSIHTYPCYYLIEFQRRGIRHVRMIIMK